MNITPNNYEEYFLLLADNELSPAEEASVRQFAAQHPQLQEELQLLLSCRLDTADMPAFPKEILLHPTIWNIENPQPVHTQMLNLLDNELPFAEAQQLKQQIAASPVLQTEWNTLQKTRLTADTVVYPDKKDLYRQHKIRPLVWMRWAAAAAVIIFAWILLPHETKTGLSSGTIAALPTVNQPLPVPVQQDTIAVKDISVTQKTIAATSMAAVAVTQPRSADVAQTRNKTREITVSAKPEMTAKKEALKKEGIAPAPEELVVTEPGIITLGNSNSLAATLSKDENIPVQTLQFAPNTTTLSPHPLQSTMAVNASVPNENDDYVHIAGARFDKHKMRGLFRGFTRSVTRTFSKSKMQPAETVAARSL